MDDRFMHGYDAGNLIDGVVKKDAATGRYVIVDDDGAVDPHLLLESLEGKRVRLTLISFEAMENMGKLYEAATKAFGSSS